MPEVFSDGDGLRLRQRGAHRLGERDLRSSVGGAAEGKGEARVVGADRSHKTVGQREKEDNGTKIKRKRKIPLRSENRLRKEGKLSKTPN